LTVASDQQVSDKSFDLKEAIERDSQGRASVFSLSIRFRIMFACYYAVDSFFGHRMPATRPARSLDPSGRSIAL
jgi:hypothetical protein